MVRQNGGLTTKGNNVISIGVKELLESGVHFGHQTKRWNPKMKPFIFDARNGIHIIDLSKTLTQLETACDFLAATVARGDRVLFVGTKKQAQQAVKETAKECGQFYVTERWLGGTLTNFATIKKSLEKFREIEATLADLKARGLVRMVYASSGARAVKYRQVLDERLDLTSAERAVLTVLLLRGPQAAGELKARTERLHPFDDKDDVEQVLRRMAALPEPLVRELPRRAGQREDRWVHLLGPVPVGAADAEAAPAVDREAVLAEGGAVRDAKVIAAYDAAAEAYAAELADELIEKPFDIWLLERVAEAADGPIMDVGCGPGHIAAFLADTGAEVHGMDASGTMIEQARTAFPDLDFQVARFHQLLRPRTAATWGAIIAWYAFGHLAPSELSGVLRTASGTLNPGGLFALAVELGDRVRHADSLCGVEVDLDYVLHDRAQVLAALAASDLVVDEWYVRAPVRGEADTERLYVVARRAG